MSKQERKFCPKCAKCKEATMEITIIPYDITIYHNASNWKIHIPEFSVPQCTECGEISIDDTAEDQITNAIGDTIPDYRRRVE